MGRNFHHKHYSCPEGMGYCTKCDSYKPLDDFLDSKEGFNGKNPHCRECRRAYNEKTRARRALRMKRRNYGVSETEYLAMWEQQGGVCAICGKPETKVHKGAPVLMAVDHNHQTGKVRGLLCYVCNLGLGIFRDDRDLIQRAVDYLHETDDERTQNPRKPKDASRVPEVNRKVEYFAREVKGLPKQLSGSMADVEGLPLFGVQY